MTVTSMDWRTARRGAFAMLVAFGVAAVATAEVFPSLSSSSNHAVKSIALRQSTTDDAATLVDIPDAALRKAVEEALGKAHGDPVTRGEMADLRSLSSSGVRQLEGIEYATGLEELSLTSTFAVAQAKRAIRDIGLLAGLSSLTALVLRSNNISDISPLAGLTSLTSLDLFANSISDVSPLASLTSLGSLDLQANEFSDVSPLAGLTSLWWLNLSYTGVTDLSPLANLKSLRDLRLNGNSNVELASLADLSSLRVLFLASNSISDVSRLAGLTALEYLDLGHNLILNVSPLAGLTSLQYLTLANNDVVELAPLAGLTSLWGLDLQTNAISDVSPLVANDGLGDGDRVELAGNPLSRISRDTHVPTLRQRGVVVSFDGPPYSPMVLPDIPDAGLRAAIERAVYFSRDFATVLSLDASNRGIEDLTGLEQAAEIRGLFLDENKITDIGPLAALRHLRILTLAHNRVEDLTPLADMNLGFLALDGNSLRDLPSLPASLSHLYLSDNSISDITPLSGVQYLRELDVSANSITSFALLGGQTCCHGLEYLHANDNQVANLSSLNFLSLRELHLRNNAVRDISPLLAGEKLLVVDVRRNPLADNALAVLETLRERGVTVRVGEMVPYFPAAGGSRQGFVRIANRNERGGHVFIEAVDDVGVRAGPVRLEVKPRGAVHFNSADLEGGNATNGLGSGIGAPTAGDWRLSVVSALDVEVLSYIRTEDGFVTAMHDVVPDAMAPFFNPGSNRNQRSFLRVANTEAEPAKWTTGGYDDRGQWYPMAGSMLVRPQHTLTLTAQALEDVHGLGDGRGKWRLRVRGFPWFAMSLLESPTGHLANLSTAPDNATPLADGTTMHRLPLFPSAGGLREGFTRVINRSYFPGEAKIEAVDDGGDRFGPLTLALPPRQAVHFNAANLETGSAATGWSGVGDGDGDWRIEVASKLDLMVLGYARTADGFVTSLHDLAPVAEDGSHRVVFFNPGSNTRQVSRLRLINDGDRAASVTITGIDDEGSGSGTVALAVPAGSALSVTSAELEAGVDGLAGRLGDGDGKWRLRVRSDAPIAVMSLLETPSGHLTNVSTGTAE